MISLLRGDIYKTEYGAVYMGLTLTAVPLIIVYLFLSRYIIAGVALGGVKG
jgi:multiple sugar transport system permease protein